MIRNEAVATFFEGVRILCRTYFPLFVLYVAWYYHLVDGVWNSKTNLFLAIAWITFTYYLNNTPPSTTSNDDQHRQRRLQRQQRRQQKYQLYGEKTSSFDSEDSTEKGGLEKMIKTPPLRCCSNKSGINVLTTSRLGLPDHVFIHICTYLHPRDVTTVACLDRYSRRMVDGRNDEDNTKLSAGSLSNILWKTLWYRDYGSVILDWDVGQEALQRSMNKATTSLDTPKIHLLLQQALDELVTKTNDSSIMKQFYFQFGECYMNYLLAGQNTKERCLLGIHGHIFDFTQFAEYHPGLVEPIRKECGADVTDFFEDIPHSKAARKIARKLCLVANRSTLNTKQQRRPSSSSSTTKNSIGEDVYGNGYGLYRIPMEEIRHYRNWSVSETNTRPPPPEVNMEKVYGIDRILPLRVTVEPKKPNTVQTIRKHFMKQQSIVAGKIVHNYNNPYTYTDKDRVQIYYDPFQLQWKGWFNRNGSDEIHYFDIQD